MVVSKTALRVINILEFLQHCPYLSNDDLPVFLGMLQDVVDVAKARDIPAVQIFHVRGPSPIYKTHNTGARVSKRTNRCSSEANMTCV